MNEDVKLKKGERPFALWSTRFHKQSGRQSPQEHRNPEFDISCFNNWKKKTFHPDFNSSRNL